MYESALAAVRIRKQLDMIEERHLHWQTSTLRTTKAGRFLGICR